MRVFSRQMFFFDLHRGTQWDVLPNLDRHENMNFLLLFSYDFSNTWILVWYILTVFFWDFFKVHFVHIEFISRIIFRFILGAINGLDILRIVFLLTIIYAWINFMTHELVWKLLIRARDRKETKINDRQSSKLYASCCKILIPFFLR